MIVFEPAWFTKAFVLLRTALQEVLGCQKSRILCFFSEFNENLSRLLCRAGPNLELFQKYPFQTINSSANLYSARIFLFGHVFRNCDEKEEKKFPYKRTLIIISEWFSKAYRLFEEINLWIVLYTIWSIYPGTLSGKYKRQKKRETW